MFHTLKKVPSRYFRRVRGLFRYILDYKILLFSLLYMLFTFIAFKVLRNIPQRGTIGLLLALGIISIFFLLGFMLLRNIPKEQDLDTTPQKDVHKYVHFFGLVTFLSLTALISVVRIAPLVGNERAVEETLLGFTNQQVLFKGYVVGEPDKKYRKQQIELKQLQDISTGGQVLGKNHGYILTRVNNYERFPVGQVCTFEGTLVEPENFSDFDYKNYLRNQKTFFILENPTYTCAESEKRGGNSIKNLLIDFKEKIIEKVDQQLHEPQSSLLVGILFGKERRLEKQFEESIRIAGVSHIITASGYNITILVVAVNRILLFMPKKARIVTSLLLIWGFALFSGLTNSIIRACIMNSLSLVAVFFGRESKVHISLPVASAIFVLLDPLIILNVGFLLSISAIIGLVYISPVLIAAKERVMTKSKRQTKMGFKVVEEYIFPTLSCTIATLPVSVSTFKTFSICSVPVNAMVLPILESTMLWGVLSLLLHNIHGRLSMLLYTVVGLQLEYFEFIVNTVGNFNKGSWEISNITSLVLSTSILLMLFTLVLYFYPIDNEKYNYYLKDD